MDLRQAKSFRCDIDERGKIQILPGNTPVIRPSAGHVFGVDAEMEERDLRDAPTPDRTEIAAQVRGMLWFAAGAATVLCIVILGMVMRLPK